MHPRCLSSAWLCGGLLGHRCSSSIEQLLELSEMGGLGVNAPGRPLPWPARGGVAPHHRASSPAEAREPGCVPLLPLSAWPPPCARTSCLEAPSRRLPALLGA